MSPPADRDFADVQFCSLLAYSLVFFCHRWFVWVRFSILWLLTYTVMPSRPKKKKKKNGEDCVSRCGAYDGGSLVRIQLVFWSQIFTEISKACCYHSTWETPLSCVAFPSCCSDNRLESTFNPKNFGLLFFLLLLAWNASSQQYQISNCAHCP